MKLTGLEVLDSSIQRSSMWIKDLMQELNWSDARKTYLAFRCVLHALRDHLAVENAVTFGEQLPMLLRGLYFEQWQPSGPARTAATREDFFSYLSTLLMENHQTASAETITRAVFRLLERKVTDGEIAHIQHTIPAFLYDLWPAALRAA
jgi:uncharacterized protein (DUF2267 family)